LTRIDRNLPAKILKRFGQLRRLGARGLVRAAYALTLGPAVYSLMEPAMAVRAMFVRRRARSRALDIRSEALRKRVRDEVDPNNALLSRQVDRSAFTGRAGAGAELIEIGGRLGVRRAYGSDRGRFVQALESSLDLAELGCTPQLMSVGWEASAIVSAYVGGVPFAELPRASSSQSVAAKIEQSLLAIHRAGYVLGELEENGLRMEPDGTAIFVNLSHAVPLSGLSRDMSIYLRDLDRKRCNELFGTRLITASELRSRELAAVSKGPGHRAYASIFIRDDIRWGNIWNTDVASGRWNYFLKGHLPIPAGGTVLDLGSNNGFNPLQILRSGAASAVGVEYSESLIEDGEYLKQAFEWLDNREYDFRYIHGSFADLPNWGLGRFDVVTALCALYYLDDRQMREIARFVRTLSDMFVLQCNTDRLIYREEPDQYRRAGVEFAVELLEQAGFTQLRIIAPPGYSRPLVIGVAA
jgi:SAM-dependent methyltransferase